jgi:fructosamine-3-kinase
VPDWAEIDGAISRSVGRPFKTLRKENVAGGCINSAVVVDSGQERYFVKLNGSHRIAMFEAELAGLEELADCGSVAVPAPVCVGAAGGDAFLVLEFLDMHSPSAHTASVLGACLARMHAVAQPYFGWKTDNTVGTTPQPNPRTDDWSDFFRRYRLEYQLLQAKKNARGDESLQRRGMRLCERMGGFFQGYSPAPSLLHGDLWSGNYAAVYYGDREADLAMTELFGRFPDSFYDSYAEVLPPDPGYRVRRTLYNLYHVLNHLNLFGSGYARQAERMIDSLLSELG